MELIKKHFTKENSLRVTFVNDIARVEKTLNKEELNLLYTNFNRQHLTKEVFDFCISNNLITYKHEDSKYQKHNKCQACGNESNFINANYGYRKTCCRECADIVKVANMKLDKSKTKPKTPKLTFTKDFNGVLSIIRHYKEGTIDQKTVTSRLYGSNSVYPSILSDNGIYNMEDLYRYVHEVKETPTCEICGKVMVYQSFNKGYICDKACRTKKRLNSYTTEELKQQLKQMYEEHGRPTNGEALLEFRRQSKRILDELCEDDEPKARSRFIYDVLFDIDEAPKCKLCGEPNEFSMSEFGYRNFCSTSCATTHQFLNSTPLTQEEIDSRNNKAQQTFMAKYGTTNPSKCREIITKVRRTNEERGNWVPRESIEDFELYSRLCRNITNRQNLNSLNNIDLRGTIMDNKYHLDHKFSIYQGFNNSIPPFIIGDLSNLEMIPATENLKKHKLSSTTKEQLFEDFYK